MKNTVTIEPALESSVALWLTSQGGLAVWSNKDHISPGKGRQRLTPAKTPEGELTPPPNITFGAKPDFVITDPALILVRQVREIQRIKVRQSTNARGLSRQDQAMIDAAKLAAGRGATHRIDYSDPLAQAPWCMAVIELPALPRPINPHINERLDS